MKGKCKFS